MGSGEGCGWADVSGLPFATAPGTRTLHLSCAQAPEGDGMLLGHPPAEGGAVRHAPRRARGPRGSPDRIGSIGQIFRNVRYTCDFDRLGHAAFTSEPLRGPLTVLGAPVLSVWVRAPVSDLSVHALLLEECPDTGHLTYVTEGVLRAAHRRARARPPRGAPREFAHVPGTPFHSFEASDVAPLVPGEPARVDLALLPVGYRFGAGRCLRLALFGNDRRHFLTGLHREVAGAGAARPLEAFGSGDGARVGDLPEWVDFVSGPENDSTLTLPVLREGREGD